MENSIVLARKSYEKKIGGSFKPDTNTYNKTGINPKRLGMLLKGKNKKDLTINEAIILADLFGVEVKSLI
jgi:3-deoxy-D-arabino-heptulosonate 7-phosphate (DAHP) synthase